MPLIDEGGAPEPRQGLWRRIRPLDIAILALSTAALVVLSVAVYGGPAPATLIVSTEADEWVYPLSQDRDIEVKGLLGVTRIRIEDGQAHIEDSPCANRTCVASPPIRYTGEWAACLPNGVFLRVEGPEIEGTIDAFAQ